MQFHVEPRGGPNPFASARQRGPLTPVKKFSATTFKAPVTAPGTRPFRGTWRAVSLGVDGEPDGVWEYHRDEATILRWSATYVATGQSREFTNLDDAREATAGPLLGELRGEAFAFAFDAATPDGEAFTAGVEQRLQGQRWIAIHMRIAGHTNIDTTCSCGGLLTVALKDGRYAHVDACAGCRDSLPAACPNAEAHVFCARPDPQLTDLEVRMLEFETQWWTRPGAKVTAIRAQFDMTEIRFYAVLNRVIDKPAAAKRYPLVVRRLRDLRARRARATA